MREPAVVPVPLLSSAVRRTAQIATVPASTASPPITTLREDPCTTTKGNATTLPISARVTHAAVTMPTWILVNPASSRAGITSAADEVTTRTAIIRGRRRLHDVPARARRRRPTRPRSPGPGHPCPTSCAGRGRATAATCRPRTSVVRSDLRRRMRASARTYRSPDPGAAEHHAGGDFPTTTGGANRGSPASSGPNSPQATIRARSANVMRHRAGYVSCTTTSLTMAIPAGGDPATSPAVQSAPRATVACDEQLTATPARAWTHVRTRHRRPFGRTRPDPGQCRACRTVRRATRDRRARVAGHEDLLETASGSECKNWAQQIDTAVVARARLVRDDLGLGQMVIACPGGATPAARKPPRRRASRSGDKLPELAARLGPAALAALGPAPAHAPRLGVARTLSPDRAERTLRAEARGPLGVGRGQIRWLGDAWLTLLEVRFGCGARAGLRQRLRVRAAYTVYESLTGSACWTGTMPIAPVPDIRDAAPTLPGSVGADALRGGLVGCSSARLCSCSRPPSSATRTPAAR